MNFKPKCEVAGFAAQKTIAIALSEAKPITSMALLNTPLLCVCVCVLMPCVSLLSCVCDVSTVCETNQSPLEATNGKHKCTEERRERETYLN